jgi:hypothetical protein
MLKQLQDNKTEVFQAVCVVRYLKFSYKSAFSLFAGRQLSQVF